MAKQQEAEVKRKAYVGDYRIKFGVMEAIGNLYSRTKPKKKDTQTHLACPVHGESGAAVRMRQAYLCTVDDSKEHGDFTISECLHGQYVDDAFVLIDHEARAAAKADTDLPDKVLELVAHPADEIGPWLAQSGHSYLFEPKGAASILNSVLLEIMNDDGTVDTEDGRVFLVGQTLIRGEERMVVLGLWNGRVTVNEVERPENLIPLPRLDIETTEDRVVELTRTLIASSTEPFDPAAYANKQRQRILDAITTDGDGPEPKARKKKENTEDLIAMLEASIASKK